jgi:hypothetical protein
MASIWTSAAQAEQQGFDKLTYLTAKATQLGPTWTAAMVEAAFASAGLEAYQHYQEFGWKEGLSPNLYFSSSYYNTSKAIAAGVTDAEFQTAWNMANGGAQTSTYFHYLQFGAYENTVNPASVFDDYQYYVDKAALLGDGTTWEQVRTTFQQNGLTPITHYMLYGGAPNEPTPKPVSGSVGETIVLTTAAQAYTGTDLNDTFISGESGGAKTLVAGDSIDGKGGTDTLTVSASLNTQYNAFTMKNVENLNVTADDGAVATTATFDLSGTSGLQKITSVNSTGDVVANNVTTVANVGLENATAAADMTVGYQAGVLNSTSDTVALTLANSSAGTIKLGTQGTDTGVETVKITTSGGASTVVRLDSDITTLTFAGDQNLKINTDLNDTVKVIDASSAKGGLTVGIGAANPNAVTFTGGEGADSIAFAVVGGVSSLTKADLIAGGAGSDTLTADQAGLEAAGAAGRVTQMETIKVSTQLTGTTFKGSYFSDATTLDLTQGYSAATINKIDTDTQAVKIGNGTASVGLLTITDDATSATGDQATLGVYDGTTAAVAYTTGELETVNLTSGSTTATVATKNVNTLNLTAGLGNVTTLNISGADGLALTTAASGITTINGGTALGGLNLTNVTYSAAIARTTDTGATIVTGSGNDTVDGTIGKDTITLGAGQDLAIGTQGADSIALGSDAVTDTVQYGQVNQSNALSGVDTITNFVSGTDQVDLMRLGTETFNGNYATQLEAQGALTGGGVSSAVFDQSASILWVDVDGNGTLDNNDLQVKMAGVTTLDAATDFIYGAVNKISLTGLGAVVNGTFATKATGVTTNGPDVISTSAANLNGAILIDGLEGNNTINITTQITAAGTLATAATNIQTFNVLQGMAAGASLVMGAGDFTVNLTDDGAASTNAVLLGVGAQIVNGTADVEDVTLGAAAQSVYALGGNDLVRGTTAEIAGATALNGGAGIDTLFVAGNVATPSLVIGNNVSQFETLNLVTSVFGETVTLGGNNAFGTLVLGAGDTVNATDAQVGGLTNVTGGTATLNITSVGGASDVTGVTFASALSATNLSTGNDTLHVNDSAAATGDIDSLGAINGGTGNDTLVVNTAITVATDLNKITGFETVSLSGAANTITTADGVVAAGATMTVDATGITGALNFDGSLEADGHFVINTAAVAGNIVEGGLLSDTINLSTSALTTDQVVLGNSTALNLDNVDTVSGFQAGTDQFQVASAGAGKATYSVTVASTATPTFVGDVNAALAAAGITTVAGDAILVTVSGGSYAGTYAISDSAGGVGIDSTAEVVKVTGTIGNITAADFI